MLAQFTPDTEKGAGYGIITVPQTHITTVLTFAICRSSDRLYLAPTNWQSSAVYLQANILDNNNNTLRIAVDATVVNQLNSHENYRLFIKDGDTDPVTHTLRIDSIVYSSMDGGGGISSGQKIVPIPVPEPEPLPEPEPQELLITPPSPSTPEPEEPAKNKKAFIIGAIIALLLLIAAGFALWWYLQKDLVQDPAQSSTQDNTPSDNTANTTPTPHEANSPTLAPLQQAREHLRNNGASDTGWQLAETLRTQALEAQKMPPTDGSAPDISPEEAAKNAVNTADAIFLLAEDAAQNNIAPAMLQLGAYYDPSDTAPKGSISPDPLLAYQWYTKAGIAGQKDAQARLDALHAWAKKAAADNEPDAKHLLEIWK